VSDPRLSEPQAEPNASTATALVRQILVPDAGLGVKWFVPEPDSESAARLLDTRFELHTPSYFFTEAASVLQRKIVVERTLSEAEGLEAFQLLLSMSRPHSAIGASPASCNVLALQFVSHETRDMRHNQFCVSPVRHDHQKTVRPSVTFSSSRNANRADRRPGASWMNCRIPASRNFLRNSKPVGREMPERLRKSLD